MYLQEKLSWILGVRFTGPVLYRLTSLLHTFAFMICNFFFFFSQEMEQLWAFRDLLANITQVLSGCCIAELLPLLDLPGIKKVSLSVV